MNEYRWIATKEKSNPDKAGYYKCTLNDGNVYDVYGTFFANGWFWQFNESVQIHFRVNEIGKPKVIAWFPNPKPYVESK